MSASNYDKVRNARLIRERGSVSIDGASRQGKFSGKIRIDIEGAARWLRENRDWMRREGKHPVPILQERFLLSRKQACEAIRIANGDPERGSL